MRLRTLVVLVALAISMVATGCRDENDADQIEALQKRVEALEDALDRKRVRIEDLERKLRDAEDRARTDDFEAVPRGREVLKADQEQKAKFEAILAQRDAEIEALKAKENARLLEFDSLHKGIDALEEQKSRLLLQAHVAAREKENMRLQMEQVQKALREAEDKLARMRE